MKELLTNFMYCGGIILLYTVKMCALIDLIESRKRLGRICGQEKRKPGSEEGQSHQGTGREAR